MKRITIVLGVVAVMAAMLVALVAPAMAKDNDGHNNGGINRLDNRIERLDDRLDNTLERLDDRLFDRSVNDFEVFDTGFNTAFFPAFDVNGFVDEDFNNICGWQQTFDLNTQQWIWVFC